MECEVDERASYTNDANDRSWKDLIRVYQEYNYIIFQGKVQKIMHIKYSYEFLQTLKNEGDLFKSKKKAELELIKRRI